MTNKLHGSEENQVIAHAWNEMLGGADTRLCQLLAEKVESTIGREPQMQEVRVFLQSLHVKVSTADAKQTEPRVKVGWYSVNGGNRVYERGAVNVVKGALNGLADVIPNFLEIFEVRSREHIRARQKNYRYWIADDPQKLYANIDVDPMRASKPLCPGWWMTNKPQPEEWRAALNLTKQIAQEYGVELDFEVI